MFLPEILSFKNQFLEQGDLMLIKRSPSDSIQYALTVSLIG